MGDIIVFPEIEELEKEIERLRTDISMLMAQRDELQFVVCKNIEMEYMLRLGGLEHQAFSLQCKYLRLKRKAEMIRARLNRREQVDLELIDAMLDEEFAAYQANLDEQIRKMRDAANRKNARELTEEETKEVKRRYRRIVKALHPDLNPDATPAQIDLFHQAVSAYENGDLMTLRMIDDMVCQEDLPAEKQNAVQELQNRREQLRKLAETVRTEIDTIKTSFPYTERELLRNEAMIEERREDLQALIDEYTEAITEMQERINDMMR